MATIIAATLLLPLPLAIAYSGTIIKNVAVPGLTRGMDYTHLGTSDLLVSKVCMGTMTFGKQNTLDEGVSQLNMAFDKYGINFIDTAEIYPTPPSKDTLGLTDLTIASFLEGRKREGLFQDAVCDNSGEGNRIGTAQGYAYYYHDAPPRDDGATTTTTMDGSKHRGNGT